MRREQPGDLHRQPGASGMPRRRIAVPPLVEPRRADPQRPTRGGVRDLVLLPLGDDELGHRYRPIASSTQRATERLSTSRCIRSSITSRRSRSNSARSSGSRERSFFRVRLSRAHQLPSVPSLMPKSRATCAIGLPVSTTSCTAPCLKSSSNFRYFLPIARYLLKGDVSTLRGEAQIRAEG